MVSMLLPEFLSQWSFVRIISHVFLSFGDHIRSSWSATLISHNVVRFPY
jgi:hypothetical protein